MLLFTLDSKILAIEIHRLILYKFTHGGLAFVIYGLITKHTFTAQSGINNQPDETLSSVQRIFFILIIRHIQAGGHLQCVAPFNSVYALLEGHGSLFFTGELHRSAG